MQSSTPIHKSFLLIVFCVFGFSLFSQSPLYDSAVKYADHCTKKETRKMVGYFHPTVIEAMGGENKAIELTEKKLADFAEQGVEIISYQIGDKWEESQADELRYALVPQYILSDANGNRMRSESYLLAIEDNHTWKFVDTGDYSQQEIEEFFPPLRGRLTIPEKKFQVVNKSE